MKVRTNNQAVVFVTEKSLLGVASAASFPVALATRMTTAGILFSPESEHLQQQLTAILHFLMLATRVFLFSADSEKSEPRRKAKKTLCELKLRAWETRCRSVKWVVGSKAARKSHCWCGYRGSRYCTTSCLRESPLPEWLFAQFAKTSNGKATKKCKTMSGWVKKSC